MMMPLRNVSFALCLSLVVAPLIAGGVDVARQARTDYEFDKARRLLEAEVPQPEAMWELGWLFVDCLDTDQAAATFGRLADAAAASGDAV